MLESNSTFSLGIASIALGAAVALSGIGTVPAAVALGFSLLGVLITAPRAYREGGLSYRGWRMAVFALGFALVGLAISIAAPGPGGLMLGAGCVGAIGAALVLLPSWRGRPPESAPR